MEAGFPISGRRLWDAPSLINVYYRNNDLGSPAVPGPPGGLPAPAGRVGRRLEFPISGRRLWDAPSLLRIDSRSNEFRPPAVPRLPDLLPASSGWVDRMLDFRSRAGSRVALGDSQLEYVTGNRRGVLPSYEKVIIKTMILGLRPSRGLRSVFRHRPAGSAGGWTSDLGPADLGCSVLSKVLFKKQ